MPRKRWCAFWDKGECLFYIEFCPIFVVGCRAALLGELRESVRDLHVEVAEVLPERLLSVRGVLELLGADLVHQVPKLCLDLVESDLVPDIIA